MGGGGQKADGRQKGTRTIKLFAWRIMCVAISACNSASLTGPLEGVADYFLIHVDTNYVLEDLTEFYHT